MVYSFPLLVSLVDGQKWYLMTINSDRDLPFFKLLRKSDKFEWNDDASRAF